MTTMDDLKTYRVCGWFGLAFVVLALAQFPLYSQGDASVSIYNGAALASDFARIHTVVFLRILLDLGLYVVSMVFAATFSHLIRRSRPEYGWVATLVFGAMAVWVGVTLVANSMEGGIALDTLNGNADPSVARALMEGMLLIYNGSIAFVITGLFLGAAGYATFVTGILPRWTGWLAYIGAALCALCIPAMFGGAVDMRRFYNAGGWGPVIIANFPDAIWFVVVSVFMIRVRQPISRPDR